MKYEVYSMKIVNGVVDESTQKTCSYFNSYESAMNFIYDHQNENESFNICEITKNKNGVEECNTIYQQDI